MRVGRFSFIKIYLFQFNGCLKIANIELKIALSDCVYSVQCINKKDDPAHGVLLLRKIHVV